MSTKSFISAQVITLILAMSIIVAIGSVPTKALALQDEAKIQTDKIIYCYSETVTIAGSTFLPETPISVTVSRPDGSTVTWSDLTSDTNGDFVTDYTPGDVPGRYSVTATDGIFTAESVFLVVSYAIWTDKLDYGPDEAVTIFGIGFEPNREITLSVTRPDSVTDMWILSTGIYGNFTTTYTLDGITGLYDILATDGSVEATTSFSDAYIVITPTEGVAGFTYITVRVYGVSIDIDDDPEVYFGGNYVTDCSWAPLSPWDWSANFQVPATIGAGNYNVQVWVPDEWDETFWANDCSCNVLDGCPCCKVCVLGLCTCDFCGVPFLTLACVRTYPGYWFGPEVFTVLVDSDGDNIPDKNDACPYDAENDADGDGICGDVDNCPYDAENDADGDGICGDVDNCPNVSNPGQEDTDGDGIGDMCDATPASLFSDTLLILPMVVLTGTLVIHRRRRKYSLQN